VSAPAWASAGWIPRLEVLEIPWLDEYRDRHAAAVAACVAAMSAREQLDERFVVEDAELEDQAAAGESIGADAATPLESRARQRAEANAAHGAAWGALRELAAEQSADLAERLPAEALEALEAANRRLELLPLSRRQQVYEAIRRDDVALTALCQALGAEAQWRSRKSAEAAIA